MRKNVPQKDYFEIRDKVRAIVAILYKMEGVHFRLINPVWAEGGNGSSSLKYQVKNRRLKILIRVRRAFVFILVTKGHPERVKQNLISNGFPGDPC